MYGAGNVGLNGSVYIRDTYTDWTYVETYGFLSPFWNAYGYYTFDGVDLSTGYWIEVAELDAGMYAQLYPDKVTIEEISEVSTLTADFDGSGIVDANDLATLVGEWLDEELWH